ncbi:MAG: helix-turn-helix domain-containing protein [Alphaproteobacteria bacterium]|nr:helix-turn-helix domain-containing protein [Alphaproteobacteria bacterium]
MSEPIPAPAPAVREGILTPAIKPATTPPVLVTIAETCRLTGLGRTKIFELINHNKLKSVTIGRRRLVSYKSILTLAGEAA